VREVPGGQVAAGKRESGAAGTPSRVAEKCAKVVLFVSTRDQAEVMAKALCELFGREGFAK
jgi:hypothetical protein